MKSISICLACVGLSFLTACQSTDKPPLTRNMEVNQQTQYFVEAKIALDKLKQDINQGREDQLAYFAPNTFKEAIVQFDSATEEYVDIGRNGASSLNIFQSDTEQYEEAKQEIMSFIALSNQKLKFSYSIRETAESTLAETFTQKELLKRINAHKIYAKDYKKINLRIHALVKKIDDGKVTVVQEQQPALLIDMQALELRTVRKNALSQLDHNIAVIKKKTLTKLTPISFQQLLTARTNANAVITADPRATDEIKTAVELAEFELSHLYHIVKEVSALQKISAKSYEQYLLSKEALLHTVSKSLETDDVRDLALTDQVKSIALQAKAIKGKLTSAAATMLALQSDNTQSTAAAENLSVGFTSQLISLNDKYDILVIENAELTKAVQSKNIEIIRLKAYKEAVLQIEGKNEAEKALALKAQSKKEVEQKALSLKKEAEKAALALAEKTKIEAKEKALALEEKAKKEAFTLEEKIKTEAEQKELALKTQEAATASLNQPVEASKIEVEANVVNSDMVEAIEQSVTTESN